jgi:hypothetical protein
MTNELRRFSNFTRFGQLLGYKFVGLQSPRGHRMHLDTSKYNKKKIQPLYIPRGKPGDTANLLPLYDILHRMFRVNISPSGGNNDSIRGGILHLLHHAHLIIEKGEDCEGKELDVMHFIFSEMHIAMIDRKILPYALFIMKLILDKGVEGEFEIDEDIPFEGVEAHKLIKFYKRTAHLMTRTPRAFAPSDSSEDLGGNRYASGCRRKNADPPSGHMGQEFKKLKGW